MAADDSTPADHVFDTDTRARPFGSTGRFDATLRHAGKRSEV
jgi:glutamine synthetase adenylyltransferase